MKKKILAIVSILFLTTQSSLVFAEGNTGNTTASVTFLPGTLSLAEMSSIHFGSHDINDSQLFLAEEERVFLDVADFRGTGDGWNVTALASNFQSGQSTSLPGSKISFLNGASIDKKNGNSAAPAVSGAVNLDCDGTASAKVVSADENHGLGDWGIEWNGVAGANENTSLFVPLPTQGDHAATITWTLAVGP